MISKAVQKDLVILVADKDMELTIKGILSRPLGLGVRAVTSDCYVHPGRDPGCLLDGHNFLRASAKSHAHALIIFDREGCGQERYTREDLETEVEEHLVRSGWNADVVAAVAIDPELEIWVWSDSPHVEAELGWTGKQPDLRTWLKNEGFLIPHPVKPARPKEAVDAALRFARKPRSPSLFLQLAQKVSFERCTDPAFEKLKRTLRNWFAVGN